MGIEPEIKLKAKDMYLSGVPLLEIADTLSISLNTLKNWVNRAVGTSVAWADLKKGVVPPAEVLEDATSDALHLDATVDRGIRMLDRALAAVEEYGECLNLDDMRKLTQIIDTVDRIRRQRREEEAEITENTVISNEEAQKNIEMHPFFRKSAE